MIDKKTNMRTPEESIKVAKRRTETMLNQLKLMSNLSNSYYDLTDGQLKDILKALEEGMRDVKNKFANKSSKTNGTKLFNPKW